MSTFNNSGGSVKWNVWFSTTMFDSQQFFSVYLTYFVSAFHSQETHNNTIEVIRAATTITAHPILYK